MKIGIDIRLIGKKRTGDEVVFFNLVQHLAKIDEQNSYFLFTDVVDELKIAEIAKNLGIIERKNFQIISIKTLNRFSWNFWDLARQLKSTPVDVYLTQYITPFFVPKKIKIVTIIHDISWNFFPQFIKKSDLFFLRFLLPLSLKRADKILGVSKFTRDELEKYYSLPLSKLDYFQNALSEDYKKQDISPEKLEQVQKKYHLPEKFMLYLGTLQPRKNIPLLLESFALTRDKLPNFKVVLVGNRQAHNFDQKIDETIRKHGLEDCVVFPGFADEEDKAAIYKLAQVFVFPSLYEGFGIPLLEAFAVKTPVLASNIPSLQEVAQNSALLVNPGDIDKFAKALYDICINDNLRNNLTDLAVQRAKVFLWENAAKKVRKVFESLV